METVPWTGRIVDAADGALYVNAGRQANLSPGQRLVVWTVVKELSDPASGASLGAVESRVGEVELETVQEKFSVARPLAPMQAHRGDLVRLAGSSPASVLATAPPATPPTSTLAPLSEAQPLSTPPPLTVETLRQVIQERASAPAFGTQISIPIAPPAPGGSFGPTGSFSPTSVSPLQLSGTPLQASPCISPPAPTVPAGSSVPAAGTAPAASSRLAGAGTCLQ